MGDFTLDQLNALFSTPGKSVVDLQEVSRQQEEMRRLEEEARVRAKQIEEDKRKLMEQQFVEEERQRKEREIEEDKRKLKEQEETIKKEQERFIQEQELQKKQREQEELLRKQVEQKPIQKLKTVEESLREKIQTDEITKALEDAEKPQDFSGIIENAKLEFHKRRRDMTNIRSLIDTTGIFRYSPTQKVHSWTMRFGTFQLPILQPTPPAGIKKHIPIDIQTIKSLKSSDKMMSSVTGAAEETYIPMFRAAIIDLRERAAVGAEPTYSDISVGILPAFAFINEHANMISVANYARIVEAIGLSLGTTEYEKYGKEIERVIRKASDYVAYIEEVQTIEKTNVNVIGDKTHVSVDDMIAKSGGRDIIITFSGDVPIVAKASEATLLQQGKFQAVRRCPVNIDLLIRHKINEKIWGNGKTISRVPLISYTKERYKNLVDALTSKEIDLEKEHGISIIRNDDHIKDDRRTQDIFSYLCSHISAMDPSRFRDMSPESLTNMPLSTCCSLLSFMDADYSVVEFYIENDRIVSASCFLSASPDIHIDNNPDEYGVPLGFIVSIGHIAMDNLPVFPAIREYYGLKLYSYTFVRDPIKEAHVFWHANANEYHPHETFLKRYDFYKSLPPEEEETKTMQIKKERPIELSRMYTPVSVVCEAIHRGTDEEVKYVLESTKKGVFHTTALSTALRTYDEMHLRRSPLDSMYLVRETPAMTAIIDDNMTALSLLPDKYVFRDIGEAQNAQIPMKENLIIGLLPTCALDVAVWLGNTKAVVHILERFLNADPKDVMIRQKKHTQVVLFSKSLGIALHLGKSDMIRLVYFYGKKRYGDQFDSVIVVDAMERYATYQAWINMFSIISHEVSMLLLGPILDATSGTLQGVIRTKNVDTVSFRSQGLSYGPKKNVVCTFSLSPEKLERSLKGAIRESSPIDIIFKFANLLKRLSSSSICVPVDSVFRDFKYTKETLASDDIGLIRYLESIAKTVQEHIFNIAAPQEKLLFSQYRERLRTLARENKLDPSAVDLYTDFLVDYSQHIAQQDQDIFIFANSSQIMREYVVKRIIEVAKNTLLTNIELARTTVNAKPMMDRIIYAINRGLTKDDIKVMGYTIDCSNIVETAHVPELKQYVDVARKYNRGTHLYFLLVALGRSELTVDLLRCEYIVLGNTNESSAYLIESLGKNKDVGKHYLRDIVAVSGTTLEREIFISDALSKRLLPISLRPEKLQIVGTNINIIPWLFEIAKRIMISEYETRQEIKMAASGIRTPVPEPIVTLRIQPPPSPLPSPIQARIISPQKIQTTIPTMVSKATGISTAAATTATISMTEAIQAATIGEPPATGKRQPEEEKRHTEEVVSPVHKRHKPEKKKGEGEHKHKHKHEHKHKGKEQQLLLPSPIQGPEWKINVGDHSFRIRYDEEDAILQKEEIKTFLKTHFPNEYDKEWTVIDETFTKVGPALAPSLSATINNNRESIEKQLGSTNPRDSPQTITCIMNTLSGKVGSIKTQQKTVQDKTEPQAKRTRAAYEAKRQATVLLFSYPFTTITPRWLEPVLVKKETPQ